VALVAGIVLDGNSLKPLLLHQTLIGAWIQLEVFSHNSDTFPHPK
jgi:hypothetical protein